MENFDFWQENHLCRFLGLDERCHIWHPQSVGKRPEKLWEQIQKHPHNVRFNDFCRLVEWFGFQKKGGKGSHRTFFHPGIREILDLQPMQGEAKSYQIKQFLKLAWQYQLKGGKK